MAKETKIWFSKEHPGRTSGRQEVDVYRRASNSSKTQKIDHNDVNSGYGKTPAKVKVNVTPGEQLVRFLNPKIKNWWRN